MGNLTTTEEYFRRRGTVAEWWRPEGLPQGLALHFQAQLDFLISQFIWQGKNVLDAGGGNGRIAFLISTLGAQVYGLDISEEMIEEAQKGATGVGAAVHLTLGDIKRLPFSDDVFDCTICIETLMHLNNPRRALRELARVTKPGGVLIVGVDNSISIVALVQGLQAPQRWLYQRLVLKEVIPKTHWTHTPLTVKSWFLESGVNLHRVFGIGLFHPEAILYLWPRVWIRLIPYAFAGWFLTRVEERYRLGCGPLKNLMKALIYVGVKPAGAGRS
ncbi:MAG: class I SAM-dependent methyltransferase [Dehalococcoidia bacterium]